jgi:hypothetical protein
LLLEMASHELFICSGWPGASILLISASQKVGL